MPRVSYHFVRGNDPAKFASILVNFMGKVSFFNTFIILNTFYVYYSVTRCNSVHKFKPYCHCFVQHLYYYMSVLVYILCIYDFHLILSHTFVEIFKCLHKIYNFVYNCIMFLHPIVKENCCLKFVTSRFLYYLLDYGIISAFQPKTLKCQG